MRRSHRRPAPTSGRRGQHWPLSGLGQCCGPRRLLPCSAPSVPSKPDAHLCPCLGCPYGAPLSGECLGSPACGPTCAPAHWVLCTGEATGGPLRRTGGRRQASWCLSVLSGARSGRRGRQGSRVLSAPPPPWKPPRLRPHPGLQGAQPPARGWVGWQELERGCRAQGFRWTSWSQNGGHWFLSNCHTLRLGLGIKMCHLSLEGVPSGKRRRRAAHSDHGQ